MKLQEHFDSGSLVVIVVTLVLFVVALFLKGLTHDLLLEAGVFLVSAKLIMMAYKSSVTAGEMKQRLERIETAIDAIGAMRNDDEESH